MMDIMGLLEMIQRYYIIHDTRVHGAFITIL